MFWKKRDDLVKAGFSKVEQEFSVLRNWLDYFYQYNQYLLAIIRNQDSAIRLQGKQISELKEIVDAMPKTREEFKELVDSYYSFDGIMGRLKDIEKKVESLGNSSPAAVSQPVQSRQVMNIREKVLKKIARSSKDYIKNLVLNLVSKYGKISALQLREIIVEEQGLCSKSSFYRILEELEREDQLNIISRGKVKVYLAAQKNQLAEQ